jgi:hypothetical protein
MKGIILPDHIPVNSYEMIVLGAPPLTFITVDGLEEELETTELPDRTVASGGNTKATEFTAQHPKHHLIEDAFLESWFLMSQDPVNPLYKRAATLLVSSISRIQTRSYNMIGIFPSKRKTANLEMKNEGELNVTEWTFKCDRIIPV